MKTSKLKSRRMWANGYHGESKLALYLHQTKEAALKMSDGLAEIDAVPVAVIPLDDTKVLIEQAARAIAKERGYDHVMYAPKFWDAAKDALTAIGVLPKRKGRK